MMFRDRPYVVFVVLAAILFVSVMLGSDVLPQLAVGEGVGTAIFEHLYSAAAEPLATLVLLVPFLLLACMAASLAKRTDFKSGLGLLLLGAVLLGFVYFAGYQEAQSYRKQRMWTAATLTKGFLPFKSIPTLLVCLVVRWLVGRSGREGKA